MIKISVYLGYSLFELLVTISMATILLTIALPWQGALWQQYQSHSQIQRLIDSLHYARAMAVLDAQAILLCPINDAYAGCGKDWHRGLAIYQQTPTGLTLLQVTPAFTKAQINWNRKNQKIIFAPNGSLQNQNGSFSYQLGQKNPYTARIILSTTGRIRLDYTHST